MTVLLIKGGRGHLRHNMLIRERRDDETLGEDNRVIIREMGISQQPAEARITQSYQNNTPPCGFRLPASRTRRL